MVTLVAAKTRISLVTVPCLEFYIAFILSKFIHIIQYALPDTIHETSL